MPNSLTHFFFFFLIVNVYRREICPSGLVGVGLSTGAQVAALQQETIGTHVVGIATDAALRIEPRDHLVQEVGGLLGTRASRHGAAEGELRHPGFLEVVLGCKLLGLLDEGLEFVG